MLHQKTRLPTVTGNNPTQGAMARYWQRVGDMVKMMNLTASAEDDDSQAAAKRYAMAQQRVAQPSLPLIGHGTQLANMRLNAITEARGDVERDPKPATRQIIRRNRLKAKKRLHAAEKKHAIATRRQKARRAA